MGSDFTPLIEIRAADFLVLLAGFGSVRSFACRFFNHSNALGFSAVLLSTSCDIVSLPYSALLVD